MRNNLNKIQWCPWCGDFMILWAVKNALKELGIKKKDVVVVSGIWCSGKMSQYIDWYWAETLHGRILPFATGVKLSNPNLTVIWVWGDGDGYGIGLGHFLHTCRRNINMTYIVCDNENYALTTGQASPTTPLDIKTKSTPGWNKIKPFDPIGIAKAAWCEFTHDVDGKNLMNLKETIKNWILHNGFSHINVQQACVTWKYW